MKNEFVDDYFSSNPLSINTTSKQENKCLLLKQIPKVILSQIISFVDSKERSDCCKSCYVLYQVCKEPMGKQVLRLNNDIVKKING